jgi:hypothetical protein
MLCGIDFSTKQIDAALIPLDPGNHDVAAVTFRTAPIQSGLRGADRIRDAAHAARQLLFDVKGYEVASVWIEEPFGAYRTADRALLPLMGALVAAIPQRMSVAVIGVQEWRRALGLPGSLTKVAAIDEATTRSGFDAITEHQAEALLVALAGRQQCWSMVA